MIFMFYCPDGPHDQCPMLIDTSGIYVRPEGRSSNYICGMSPPETEDDPNCHPDEDELVVDHELFDEVIWPALAERVPAFERLQVKSYWAGFYEYNTFDQNAFIGRHPLVNNFILMNGFSGHGIQQAPAVGRAVAELIIESGYKSIDLSEFGFERYLEGQKLLEKNII